MPDVYESVHLVSTAVEGKEGKHDEAAGEVRLQPGRMATHGELQSSKSPYELNWDGQAFLPLWSSVTECGMPGKGHDLGEAIPEAADR